MLHVLNCDDPRLLPLAKNQLRKWGAAGIHYASSKVDVGLATVHVRVDGQHEYINIVVGKGNIYVRLSHGDIHAEETWLYRVNKANANTAKLVYHQVTGNGNATGNWGYDLFRFYGAPQAVINYGVYRGKVALVIGGWANAGGYLLGWPDNHLTTELLYEGNRYPLPLDVDTNIFFVDEKGPCYRSGGVCYQPTTGVSFPATTTWGETPPPNRWAAPGDWDYDVLNPVIHRYKPVDIQQGCKVGFDFVQCWFENLNMSHTPTYGGYTCDANGDSARYMEVATGESGAFGARNAAHLSVTYDKFVRFTSAGKFNYVEYCKQAAGSTAVTILGTLDFRLFPGVASNAELLSALDGSAAWPSYTSRNGSFWEKSNALHQEINSLGNWFGSGPTARFVTVQIKFDEYDLAQPNVDWFGEINPK